jgi:hypothetical protein
MEDMTYSPKFLSLLQRLRDGNETSIDHHHGDDRTSTSNTSDDEASEEDVVDDVTTISFLGKFMQCADKAAGELGAALQVQLQNRLKENHRQDIASNRNTKITKHLIIVTQCLSTDFEKYESLLEFLASIPTMPNPFLESITLKANACRHWGSCVVYGEINVQRVIAQFLQRIQHNTTLKRLTLLTFYARIDIDVFITFLNTSTIPALEMDCLSFCPTHLMSHDYDANLDASLIRYDDSEIAKEQLYNPLTLAFRNNHSIEELYLTVNSDTIFFVTAILEELMYNTTLRHFKVQCDIDDEMECNLRGIYHRADVDFSHTLMDYVSKTKTLQHLELKDFSNVHHDLYEFVLNAMAANPSIKILSLDEDTDYWQNAIDGCIPHFLYLEELHITYLANRGDTVLKEILYYTLPGNFSIRVCSFHNTKEGGPQLSRRHDAYLQAILKRNCGMQQFVREYADFALTIMSKHINRFNDDTHASGQNRDRNPTAIHTDTSNIPIELIPTILSNHFQPPSARRYDFRPSSRSTCCSHGPSLLYHILSNLGNRIGSCSTP